MAVLNSVEHRIAKNLIFHHTLMKICFCALFSDHVLLQQELSLYLDWQPSFTNMNLRCFAKNIVVPISLYIKEKTLGRESDYKKIDWMDCAKLSNPKISANIQCITLQSLLMTYSVFSFIQCVKYWNASTEFKKQMHLWEDGINHRWKKLQTKILYWPTNQRIYRNLTANYNHIDATQWFHFLHTQSVVFRN